MENLYTIENVFSGRLFQIPDYQRGYAWEQQQWRDFIEDLDLLEENKQHFMGTLLLHSGAGTPTIDRFGDSYGTHNVVDGQQRLTTVVIFLDVMSEFLNQLGGYDDLVTGMRRKYLVTTDRNGQALPKLTLNKDCRDFFFHNILNNESVQGATIRSHRLLDQAQIYFRDYLSEQHKTRGDGFGEWLENLRLKVVQRLTLMVYTVDQEADAGILFETMNNRGKSITELEKVKNYLLYIAGKLQLVDQHNLVEEVNKTWKHIFESLMAAGMGSTDNEDRLLRAHWLMVYDPNPRNWAGSRSIKQRFGLKAYAGRHTNLLEDLKIYLHTLFNATTAYVDIMQPGRSGAFQNFTTDKTLHSDIKLHARKLARVGALASFIPLLMAVRLRHAGDGETYRNVTQLCEKYAFRVYRWLRLRSNAGQTKLFRLAHNLFQGRVSPDETTRRLAQLILEYAPDSAFSARFENPDTNWYAWAGIKYFLFEYESHLASARKVPIEFTWESVERRADTIEHILPQTPDAGGYWQKQFPGDQYRRWVHDIGNLSLTFDNPALGNKPFRGSAPGQGKQEIYIESVVLMERDVATARNWTPDHIKQRREVIRQWALKRWEVILPDNPDPDAGEVTRDDYRRLLNRKGVARGQAQLYWALYQAGDAGLTSDELVEVMGRRDRKDLTGVLGALGNRINHTPGYGQDARPGIGMLVTIEPASGEAWRYIMRPEMRAALEEMNPWWLHEKHP